MSEKADFKPFFDCPLQGRTGEAQEVMNENYRLHKISNWVLKNASKTPFFVFFSVLKA